MKIADLDTETKAVLVAAHHLVKFPTDLGMRRLKIMLERFDDKHQTERNENLLRALEEASDDVPNPFEDETPEQQERRVGRMIRENVDRKRNE